MYSPSHTISLYFIGSVSPSVLNIKIFEFLSIFNGKKLCFVIAIKDSGATGRSIQNIQSFSSNIAKFALNELINNMNNLGVKLKITQIN